MQLKVKKEFRDLIPPISPEEYGDLEKSIIKEGCREPLMIWEGTIVDGHNRYKICSKHDIKFRTQDIKFESDAEAKIWIIENQFSRRNISKADRASLALKRKDIIEKKAKEKQIREGKSLGGKPTLSMKSSEGSIDTRKEIAKHAGVSEDTIRKVEIIEKIDPEAMKKIRNNEVSINQVYKNITLGEKKEKVKEKFKQKGIEDFPKGKFQVILANPPWEYDFSETQSREIENQYPTMKLKEIKELTDGKRTVKDLSSGDSVLFLWTTSPKLEEGLSVLKEWGFTYVTCAIWDKKVIGMGYYFRQQHEILLVGKKGNLPVPDPENRISSIISAKRTQHSRKPEEVYEILEKMYPDRTKIELFGRNQKRGWTMWKSGTKTSLHPGGQGPSKDLPAWPRHRRPLC